MTRMIACEGAIKLAPVKDAPAHNNVNKLRKVFVVKCAYRSQVRLGKWPNCIKAGRISLLSCYKLQKLWPTGNSGSFFRQECVITVKAERELHGVSYCLREVC